MCFTPIPNEFLNQMDRVSMSVFVACLMISIFLSFLFFFMNWYKIRSYKVLSFKELHCINGVTVGLWALAIPSVGVFPAFIVHAISFPIYYALNIGMGGDEWWSYSIGASIIYPFCVIPSYLMSKYFISSTKYQLILFFIILTFFALIVGFVSVVPHELWGVNCYY